MNPTYDFAERVSFVTGSSSGMGLATARAFAEAGATVTLAGGRSKTVLSVGERDRRPVGYRDSMAWVTKLEAGGVKVGIGEHDLGDKMRPVR